jgi:hypothetical protein
MKPEKWSLIERKPFASVADAVAFYYRQGFKTWSEGDNERIMRSGNEEVRIVHKGLLEVESSRIVLN